MPAPLYVYSIMPRGYNASVYYRVEVPMRTAEEMGLNVVPLLDTLEPDIPVENRMSAFYNSDIGLFYQPVGQSLLEHMNQIKRMVPCKRDGTWKWPPSIVIDTDDNLFDVNPMNEAYRGLGIRLPDGRELNEGDEVGIVDGQGNKRPLWKDGEGGFSVKANKEKLELYRSILAGADAVTCSTPHTQAYVQAESKHAKTLVSPNSIRLDHYEPVDLAPHPGKIRILWQGSPTHYEDWFPLRNALGYLSRRYPEIEWVIWGVLYPWVHELIPTEQFKHIKWVPYANYKLRLCTIGHDINLAPLSPTRFNLCRSAIKWYESSILKSPAATVAQKTGPYLDEIQDGETGLLFETPDQFIEKVSLLVENEMERKRIAANAKDWVVENRDAFKTVPKLVEFWRNLREEAKAEKPQPTEEEWAKISEEMKQWAEEDAAKEAAAKAEAEAQAKAMVNGATDGPVSTEFDNSYAGQGADR